MNPIKILTVIGTRPQFIKAAMISRAMRDWNKNNQPPIMEDIVHTGQHYNRNMSKVFFDDLEIPEPVVNLNISNAPHGEMTGRMLCALEIEMKQRQPDWVLIYGDTNSTLAAALAASKVNIPIAHVEAGLRSFNRCMPEEVNRILSDQVSSILLCPTSGAVENLRKEGFERVIDDWQQLSVAQRSIPFDNRFAQYNGGGHPGVVINVGDAMYDAAIAFGKTAEHRSRVLDTLSLNPRQYYLVTIHREENTENPQRMEAILKALRDIAKKTPLVFPVHPRIKKLIDDWFAGLPSEAKNNCRVVSPLGFFDMIRLEKSAIAILTDSGGVQKEAFFQKVPCITLRDETEWIETVSSGWNQIVGAQTENIIHALDKAVTGLPIYPYGNGKASQSIIEVLAAAGKKKLAV